MEFRPEETQACRRLVEMALEEDLGFAGDVTSKTVIPPGLHGQAAFVARAGGVIAGLPAVELVLETVETPLLRLERLVQDGARVQPGEKIAVVSGLMEFILTAERTALNFLQHMSGVATLTRRYVDALAGMPCQIFDTRKTIPGWRLLEKYAVRCGGGHNHRIGLYDGILIKDNHLWALGGGEIGVRRLSELLRVPEESGRKSFDVPLEIEVESLAQLPWAFACSPDIILLDNMTLEQLREAVRLRNQRPHGKRSILLEASGGVNLETVRAIASTGVERISVGAVTHSAPALDIALDYA